MTTRPTSRPGRTPGQTPGTLSGAAPRRTSRDRPGPAVRLRDPAGVVAAVPYLLGFVPSRSLVVVGIDDDQGVGPTLRTDLPAADLLGDGPPGVLPGAWAHVRSVLARNGCPRALVVLYGATEPQDLTDEAADRLLALLGAARDGHDGPAGPSADGAGPPDRPAEREPRPEGPDPLDVLDVLLVGPTRFRSLLCSHPACCPPEGSPVAATGSHPVAATFVLAGRRAAAARDDLEPPTVPAPPDERVVALAAARSSRPAATEDRALLEEWLRCLPAGPGPDLAGRLAARWRARPGLRDACLAAFLPGGSTLARLVLAPGQVGRGGGRPPEGAGSLSARLEDPACAGAAGAGATALRRMAALAPVPESADVLAAHAWLCWVSGEGTAAAVLAGRALDVDGTQALAALVLRCLDHGLGAPWTGRRG